MHWKGTSEQNTSEIRTFKRILNRFTEDACNEKTLHRIKQKCETEVSVHSIFHRPFEVPCMNTRQSRGDSSSGQSHKGQARGEGPGVLLLRALSALGGYDSHKS